MTIYYSPNNNSFYPSELQAEYEASVGGWPDDVIEITQPTYDALMEGRDNGRAIAAGANGMPILAEVVVDWLGRAEDQRQSLLDEAKNIIEYWHIELQLDTISDDDKIRLIKWMAYIKVLKALDFSSVLDEEDFNIIEWPDKPI